MIQALILSMYSPVHIILFQFPYFLWMKILVKNQMYINKICNCLTWSSSSCYYLADNCYQIDHTQYPMSFGKRYSLALNQSQLDSVLKCYKIITQATKPYFYPSYCLKRLPSHNTTVKSLLEHPDITIFDCIPTVEVSALTRNTLQELLKTVIATFERYLTYVRHLQCVRYTSQIVV